MNDNKNLRERLERGEIVNDGIGGLYAICNECKDVIRINKTALGSLHICAPPPEARRRDKMPKFDPRQDLEKKENWPDGPWMKEPDRFEFEAEGLPCLLNRNRMGAWCGYVAVLPGHPYHGVGYSDCSLKTAVPRGPREGDGQGPLGPMPARWVEHMQKRKVCTKEHCDHTPESKLDVHGGITYSNACQGEICHKPKPGEPDNMWWFGFDCGHAGDLIPGMIAVHEHVEKMNPTLGGSTRPFHYRDMAYVKRETIALAKQLKAMA